jgi:hypothetical protein
MTAYGPEGEPGTITMPFGAVVGEGRARVGTDVEVETEVGMDVDVGAATVGEGSGRVNVGEGAETTGVEMIGVGVGRSNRVGVEVATFSKARLQAVVEKSTKAAIRNVNFFFINIPFDGAILSSAAPFILLIFPVGETRRNGSE